eukprot:7544935-Pyramimonas_sp.AAC.1
MQKVASNSIALQLQGSWRHGKGRRLAYKQASLRPHLSGDTVLDSVLLRCIRRWWRMGQIRSIPQLWSHSAAPG